MLWYSSKCLRFAIVKSSNKKKELCYKAAALLLGKSGAAAVFKPKFTFPTASHRVFANRLPRSECAES